MGLVSVKVPVERRPGNPEEISRIPLKAADGSVRAFALVDLEDFDWATSWSWHLTPSGYVMRSQKRDGKRSSFYLHREILGLKQGDGLVADHINRNRLDNRRANLRALTASVSPQNRSGYGSSPFRGVKRHGGRWQARVEYPKGCVHMLGLFGSELDAAAVAAQWRSQNMPAAVEDPELLTRVICHDHPRNHRAGLADKQVIDIRRRYLAGESRREIAGSTEVPYILVCGALGGRSYKDLPLLAEVRARAVT